MIRYFLDKTTKNKNLAFYFLPATNDTNIQTDYHMMMYRLMKTINVKLLNYKDYLDEIVTPFNSITDFIIYRSNYLKRNQNNSSYVTIDESGNTIIYGKVYGASKKETTLITIAMTYLSTSQVMLYEFNEKDLKELPQKDLQVIKSLNVEVIKIDQELERKAFEKNNSLRSPKYILSLLAKLGPKKCAFCDCDIPQLIQGAHIFPVSNIKGTKLPEDEKINMATDGNNGLWLCSNHHKMFDAGILILDNTGHIIINREFLPQKSSQNFVSVSISYVKLPEKIINEDFLHYLKMRNTRKSLV